MELLKPLPSERKWETLPKRWHVCVVHYIVDALIIERDSLYHEQTRYR